MERKALLRLLILFLGFSYVLSSRPLLLPPSAYLNSGNEDPLIQEFLEQEGLMEVIRNYGEGLDEMEDAIIRGRMDIESNDYTGPGANHHHDPKTPPP